MTTISWCGSVRGGTDRGRGGGGRPLEADLASQDFFGGPWVQTLYRLGANGLDQATLERLVGRALNATGALGASYVHLVRSASRKFNHAGLAHSYDHLRTRGTHAQNVLRALQDADVRPMDLS
jgi:hypothetical protein